MANKTCGAMLKEALDANPGKTARELAGLAGVSWHTASVVLNSLRRSGQCMNTGHDGQKAAKWYPLAPPPNLDHAPPEYLRVPSIFHAGMLIARQHQGAVK